jgi:hypothetical protein
MSTDREKTVLGISTIRSLFDIFGGDVYAQILLEVLLEGVMNEEAVFVFGEQEQEGDQTDHSASERVDSNVEADGSLYLEVAPDLGA